MTTLPDDFAFDLDVTPFSEHDPDTLVLPSSAMEAPLLLDDLKNINGNREILRRGTSGLATGFEFEFLTTLDVELDIDRRNREVGLLLDNTSHDVGLEAYNIPSNMAMENSAQTVQCQALVPAFMNLPGFPLQQTNGMNSDGHSFDHGLTDLLHLPPPSVDTISWEDPWALPETFESTCFPLNLFPHLQHNLEMNFGEQGFVSTAPEHISGHGSYNIEDPFINLRSNYDHDLVLDSWISLPEEINSPQEESELPDTCHVVNSDAASILHPDTHERMSGILEVLPHLVQPLPSTASTYLPENSSADKDFVSEQLPSLLTSKIYTASNIKVQESLLNSLPIPMEDYMHVFKRDRRVLREYRKRRAYTIGRRHEVADIRKRGACNLCRNRKISCSTGRPCNNCLRKAGNVTLASPICDRQTLLEARKSIKFSLIMTTCHILADFLADLKSLEEKLFANALLVVEVRTIYLDGCGSIYQRHRVSEFNLRRRQTRSHIINTNTFRRESLPPAEELYIWGLELLKLKNQEYPEIFSSLLVRFLLAANSYRIGSDLMHDLISCAIRLAAFCQYVRHWPNRVVFSFDDQLGNSLKDNAQSKFIDYSVFMQIKPVAIKAMEIYESRLLSILDKLMAKKMINQENSTLVGMCLWFLILFYRNTVQGLSILEPESLQFPMFREHLDWATFMYNKLIGFYATVFPSTSSPFYHRGNIENHIKLFGGNDELVAEFERLDLGIRAFEEYDSFAPCDELLKKLIIDPQRKHRPRQSQ